MKLIKIIFIFLLSFSIANAQVVNTSDPTSDGDSADYDLTDQERVEADNYIHEGLSQRTMDEACAELDDPSACSGNVKTEFLGVDSDLVKAVVSAYSAVMGMLSLGGGTSIETQKTDAAGKDIEGETDESKDYCAMIPLAGEIVATTMQTLGQEDIVDDEYQESPQIAQLYKAARSHSTRAKTAKIQGSVFTATATCYVAYIPVGGATINTSIVLKTVASAFLAWFYWSEAEKQAQYAKEVNAIADSMPGKGDCNPHTENNCYCSQEETQYDTTYCIETLNKKITNTNSYSVPCVDADLKADANCSCVGKESCFDSEFFTNIQGTGAASFGTSSAGNNFKNLTNGVLTNGKLTSTASSSAAAAKKLLKDMDEKITDMPELTKSQMEMVKAMKGQGLKGSKALASIASTKATAKGKKMASGVKSNGSGKKSASNSKKSSSGKVLTFGRTSAIIGGSKKSSGNDLSSMLNKLKKKKTKGGSNGNILKFANQASKSAQISKNKNRPIFEIISRRYQVSGWKRLEIK